MRKITIAQPYVVLWNWGTSHESEVVAWMRENIKSHYEGFYLGKEGMKSQIEADDIKTWNLPDYFIWHFECPRDAMLFKLTWGEN